MRYQGKLSNWKDDKGFGFITPNGGGQQVFVHINAFSNRRRRPVGTELVTYEVMFDAKGRAQAASVAFVGERIPDARERNPNNISLIFASVFLVLVAVLTFIGRLPITILGLYLAASLVAFVVYAIDKSAAQNDQWRTPESTLQLISLAGGWPGAALAQKLLRHKSKKQSFQVVFWATIILNNGFFLWFLFSKSALAFRSAFGLT
jgi:uncharacterized membrane protein YsdA (DUF1294 family)/cold shock CspA family protein